MPNARAAELRGAEPDALNSALCRELMVRMNEDSHSKGLNAALGECRAPE